MPYTNETPPSRLSTGTVELRDTLESRNLYTPNSEYPLQSSENSAKVVSTINTIIAGLTPFKSYNLENTVYGRLIQGNANTPLAQIGLAMLGKQMALNMMSNASQQLLPVIKVSNLFDGNPTTNLFTPHKDLAITKVEGQNDFNNFLSRIIGTKNPSKNPFNNNSTNTDYLKNTGSGQLIYLYDLYNKNIYKSGDQSTIEMGDEISNSLQPRSFLVSVGNKSYFNFDNSLQYPYSKYYPSAEANNQADKAMIDANTGMIDGNSGLILNQEYAPNYDFIENLGTSQKYTNDNQPLTSNETRNMWIGENTEFVSDSQQNIIWGKDGIDTATNEKLSELRGTGDMGIVAENNFYTTFNVKAGGLLEYTRNLIKATEGQVGDITRKAFKKGNEIIGFNGSGLWQANDSSYISNTSGTGENRAGYTGIRQHSALDQYDRFAKAIRFNGNFIYDGSPESVIYKSVMPRIHPTRSLTGNLENTNLMLSIENLAIKVISKDDVGIIDDEYGSEIPRCEVGPFNGRMMWFPPYALEINETATAKYESTVMVGRNEPMYNYQNSERSATLSFTLLVDYPPQIKNYEKGKTNTPQRDIAEFFAFGGNKVDNSQYVKNLELRLNELENKKLQIKYKFVPAAFDTPVVPTTMRIYFPNDYPHVGEESTIFDVIYKNGYEVHPDFIVNPNVYDGKCFGINQKVYSIEGDLNYNTVISGKTYYSFPTTPNYSQYTSVGTDSKYGANQLNQALKNLFDNEEMREYYEINILGHCSSPASLDYNQKLGARRAEAAKILVRSKLNALYGKSDNIVINVNSLGEVGSTGDNVVSSKAAKENRYAEISFRRNDKKYVNKNTKDTSTQSENDLIKEIDKEIDAIKSKIDNAKRPNENNITNCVMNERFTDDTAILHGFKSLSDNYYSPIFHSQTPEDFHKRLTFLQQCTRQGSSKKYDSKPDENGTLRARNSVFGRQPICILRVGDFFYTKVIIESVNIDYTDTTWDTNPEGFGMQPMLAKVTLNMKVIGGQSLKGPIDALQNAVSFNYYANSNYTDKGMYVLPAAMASIQSAYKRGIKTGVDGRYGDTDIDGNLINRFNDRNAEFKKSLTNDSKNPKQ